MNKPPTLTAESNLRTNLNELAHDLIRETAMACRKMSIYGASHPTAVRAVEKPFFIASHILKYKRFLNLNAHRGDLYALNIRLKDSPFVAQVIQFMQVLDVNAVLMENKMTVRDFSFFLETLCTRQTKYDASFSLADHLVSRGVNTIQINSEFAYDLYERGKQYRGDVEGDFSVRHLALDQLGDDLLRLARVRNTNAEGLLDLLVDFEPEIIDYLLPEKVAALDPEELRARLTVMADQLNSGESGPQKQSENANEYMALFKLVEHHPQRAMIVANLADNVEGDESGEPMSETGAIKIETSIRMEQLIEAVFSITALGTDVEKFVEAFVRLLKTGQQPKATEVIGRLVDLMGSPDPVLRQKALNLLGLAIGQLRAEADADVLAGAVTEAASHLRAKTETYEFSEFLWQLFESCRNSERYDLAAELTGAMAERRSVTDNVTVYDSMAVKKGLENISRRQTIKSLVDELISASGEKAGHLREVLVAINTEQVALALADIISHPQRAVRQLTLKILAELGKASLKVFSRILSDDAMFERETDRRELPDEEWYVVRNSIFVLGSLTDPQAVAPLRSRIDDTDVRVRREIITALEKIGGEEAVDCLTLMAEDPIAEVHQAAIIGIGLIGESTDAPILINIARSDPRNLLKAITALGKLGGYEAQQFLGEHLNDPQKLGELSAGKVGKDELRVAVVRALGKIGDQEAIEQVKRFNEANSGGLKTLFKNSAVKRAVTEVLSRR